MVKGEDFAIEKQSVERAWVGKEKETVEKGRTDNMNVMSKHEDALF